MTPPALFFFLRIAFAIWGLLWLHTNFRIIVLVLWRFDRDCVESVDCFGWCGHSNMSTESALFSLVSLAEGLSVLFTFSKNQLLVSLIFSILFLVSISLISSSFFK